MGGDGTKITPIGDIFYQPHDGMSFIRSKLADHVGDYFVLSPEGTVLVTSPGTELSYPRPPQSLNNSKNGSPSPSRRTPEQVPPAPSAPQQYLSPIAEERESTAGEGASGEGASSQDGGRVVDLDREPDLDMTGVGPVLPATRKAPAAEAGVGTGGVAEGNPSAPLAPSRRAEIGGVNDSSQQRQPHQ